MDLRRLSALVLLFGAALTAGANGQSADRGPYWLGPSYLGLQLRVVPPSSYIYGTCDPPPDGGCVPPYEVQHHRSCGRNPLTGGGQPSRVYRVGAHGLAGRKVVDAEACVLAPRSGPGRKRPALKPSGSES